MKFLMFICLFLTGFTWAQTSTTASIHSIDLDPAGNDHFIKLDSGEVIFVDDVRIIEDLEARGALEKRLEFEVDQDNELVGWRSVPEVVMDEGDTLELSKQLTTSPVYTPSVVSGKATLASMFAGLRPDAKRRSECYHRAYIWAYEEHKKSGRQMTKHFMFFTRKYIREYRYKWWFHVAPSVLYENDNGTKEFMILDRSFAKSAITVKEWSDKFVASKRSCPLVYVYSHYNNHQESEHCYMMPTPMYYLQPLDMENFEKTGVEKQSFIPWDLNISYRRGFTGRPL